MQKTKRLALILFLLLVFSATVSAALAASFGRGAVEIPAARGDESDSITAASILMTKTVGATPGVCGSGDSLAVVPGSGVHYCYAVTNNGTVTLTSHTLTDTQLGTLLAGAAITLTPGASSLFSTTAVVTQSVVNTATWMASDGLGSSAFFTDSASVSVFAPSIVLTKTVSASPGTCSTSDTAVAVPGENVTYCYAIGNTGLVTVTSHTLVDDRLGTLFTGMPQVVPPGASYQVSVTVQITDDVVNTATWTAQDNFGQSAQGVDSATVTVIDPQIQLAKTVNDTPGSCPGANSIQVVPGTVVNYCYRMSNTGQVTVTSHTLTDDQLGILLLNQPVTVGPLGSYTFSTTVQVTETVANVGIWTASDGYGHFSADNDSASVTVLDPAIVMTKTVSAAAGICAATQVITVTSGSPVTYCYTMENSGPVTVTSHTLTDDVLGSLLVDQPAVVGPGQTLVFSTTVVVNNDVSNTGTWTATELFGKQAIAVDSAMVFAVSPAIDLAKTLNTSPGVCPGSPSLSVVPGTLVNYCFELQNTGTTTLTSQTLSDDHLGLLLSNAPITIPPGQTHVISQTAVVTQPVTNIATWTATDIFSNTLQTGDSASAGIQGVSLDLVKTVSDTPGVCDITQNIAVPPGSAVTYCYDIQNTGQITLSSHTLVDSALGLLLNGAAIDVPPGQSYVFSTTVVVNSSVTNLATWTALDTFGNAAVGSDSATVTVVVPDILVSPATLISNQPAGIQVTRTLVISNIGGVGLSWSMDENQNPGSLGENPGALGDEVFRLDLGSRLGNDILVGVEFDGNNFWVTAGGISNNLNEPNLLYEFDSGGALVNFYTQTTTSPFGWRDLAFDGAFLYASDSSLIEEIDPANGQPTGNVITSPLSINRALAYDPATDHFWVGSFGDDIHELDRSGNVISTITNVFAQIGNVTGLAWDDLSPGGPYLWAWTNDVPPKAVQIDPVLGQPTGVSFVGSSAVGGDGGGATITASLYPDQLIFIGLHEAGLFNDTVVGYDMGLATGQCAANNNPWLSASPTGGVIPPGGGVQLNVVFDSSGLSPGFYDGNLCISSNDPDTPLLLVPTQLVLDFPNRIYLPNVRRP